MHRDVVFGELAPVLKLLALNEKALVYDWDTLLDKDLFHDVLGPIRNLHVECDRLAGHHLDEDLDCPCRLWERVATRWAVALAGARCLAARVVVLSPAAGSGLGDGGGLGEGDSGGDGGGGGLGGGLVGSGCGTVFVYAPPRDSTAQSTWLSSGQLFANVDAAAWAPPRARQLERLDPIYARPALARRGAPVGAGRRPHLRPAPGQLCARLPALPGSRAAANVVLVGPRAQTRVRLLIGRQSPQVLDQLPLPSFPACPHRAAGFQSRRGQDCEAHGHARTPRHRAGRVHRGSHARQRRHTPPC
ncbi:hypothetical protein T492DRAFT_184921 [Pavlovales sp. CCMP2436]|nr:hypothetical protein T492DRAFT_184921 [Pavlovales sp. CCMP2436]